MLTPDSPAYALLVRPIRDAMAGRSTVPLWIPQAALHALAQGHAHAITARSGGDLYLARYWLTTPRRAATSDAADCPWDSGESILLHAIVRPDDDDALHDHPWDFTTEILHGGYHEAEPSRRFLGPLGPGGDDIAIRARGPGERRHHAATSAHTITDVQPQTWTLVQTGPRVRAWGFWATDQPWQPWREYLSQKVGA